MLLVFRSSGNAGNIKELVLMISVASNSQVTHRRSPKSPGADSSMGVCHALLFMAAGCRLLFPIFSPDFLQVIPTGRAHGGT